MAHFSSFDGTELFYNDEGDGTPVVLLHGLSSSTQINWKASGIWSELVAVGMRVIGLDARGHGRSSKPHEPEAYEGDAMEQDLSALLDHLGLERINMVGYSMGAATAIRFATTHCTALRRLAVGGIGGDPAAWSDPADGGPSDEAKRWMAGLDAADPDHIEDPVARRAREGFEARGNDLKAIAALLRANRRRLSNDLALNQITIPTLVACGDQDADPRPLAAALPQGEAVVVEGDHESVLANPQLAKTIVGFLTG